MIRTIYGDITNAREDIIVHQVNAIGVMGGGVARSIRDKYPEVFTPYKEYIGKAIEEGKTPEDLLGNVLYVNTNDGKVIANVFGQAFIREGPSDKEVYTQYDALALGLRKVLDYAVSTNKTVAAPYLIGAGMANGSWSKIGPMLTEIFDKHGLTLYNKQD